MLDREIQEVIYIAIGAVVLSVVLGLAAIMMQINDGFADIRNNEVQGKYRVQQYREYNKYDKKTLLGNEVIELITLAQNTGTEVLVYSYPFDSLDIANSYIEDSDNNEYANSAYNYDKSDSTEVFLRYRPSDKVHGYNEKYKPTILNDNFITGNNYRAYLVYNSYKPGIKFNEMVATLINLNNLVDDLDKVDEAFSGKNGLADSEVTGIILVRLPKTP